MGESELPNTESFDVMRTAIAYEIAKRAMTKLTNPSITPEAYAKQYADIYMKTWNTIFGRKDEPEK